MLPLYFNMDFSELVLEQLDTIFKKYDLQVIEQRRDYLKLQSEVLTIIIAHNELEHSNVFWLGERGKVDLVEINNKLLELYFKSKLKLSQVSVEIFVKNLCAFFRCEGKYLFESTTEVYKLEEFDLKSSQEHTRNLISAQNLVSADIAWKDNDYSGFIKILDEIDQDVLPSSYKLKYKIAQNKK
jgi:hypothetical protein